MKRQHIELVIIFTIIIISLYLYPEESILLAFSIGATLAIFHFLSEYMKNNYEASLISSLLGTVISGALNILTVI